MPSNGIAWVAQLAAENEKEILSEWFDLLRKAGGLETGRLKEGELQTQSRKLLDLLRNALKAGSTDAANAAFEPVRAFVAEISRSRALQGFTSAETARFVFSLKQPLANMVNRAGPEKSAGAGGAAPVHLAADR